MMVCVCVVLEEHEKERSNSKIEHTPLNSKEVVTIQQTFMLR